MAFGGFGGGYGGWFGGPPSRSSLSRVATRYWKPGEDFLQNSFHFPSFKNLPHENSLEYGYWERDNLGRHTPACIWFFMAEIVNAEASQSSFLRNRVDVRDRDGGECPIFFYPKDLGDFDFKTLKKGSTILVTNGQKHNFLDLSVGLRIEYLDCASVMPCSMSDLLQLSNVYHTKKGTRCWSCSTLSTSASVSSSDGDRASAVGSGNKLKKCAACKMAVYCSRSCQIKDWKEGHKRTCKAMPLFHKLTLIDFLKYDDGAFLRLT